MWTEEGESREKAVVSAIPIYYLQHTWLTRSEANKCDAAMRKFFWGQWEETKSLTMISWKRLCAQKKNGGLGFRQMTKLNEALLAKQGWRILTAENSLVSQIFMGMYRGSVQNYNLTPKASASPLWKRICQASKIVMDHMGWRVGNGEKISLYDSKWIPPDHHNHNFITLGELMIPGGYWDREKVTQVYTGRNRLNIRTENIENPSMSNWICQMLNDCTPAGQAHYHDMILPLLTICWSIYTQRNEILFQQGNADVMECLHRAYRVVDELQRTRTLPRHDPFFKSDVPRRQRRAVDRFVDHHSHHLNLICQWTKDFVKRKKGFWHLQTPPGQSTTSLLPGHKMGSR
ncbi:ribonuclease H [Senna tora]|uniref:Ribonuclease H n=1 Tax=Senna tora TaxID=362788 RepID=A0A834XFF1_9FABA|nr:ribonuclease H [Senna tora]